MEIRTGIGYDLHRLVKGRKLILGGITIPHTKGSLAHSDGDALVHAVIDALFGAAALGDIGTHFPDTDPAYRDVNSITLLEKAGLLLSDNNYSIQNIDSIIICQEPKMTPHIPGMRDKLAEALRISPSRISIKAKTKEKISAVGKGKAIETFASCLVSRPQK
jgi:2-C-methyl-D-erythritol 2,4-cyclodiphosphate synthase